MISIGRWQYQRFHISYMLGWFALGALVGLLIANIVHPELSSVGSIIFVILALPTLRSRRWWTIGIAIMLGVICGLARGGDYSTQVLQYNQFIDEEVTVTGIISADSRESSRGTQAFQLANVGTSGIRLPGEVYVATASKTEIKRGDTVTVSGRLKGGFATYPASITFASIESVSRGPDFIRDIRERFSQSVRSYVVEPMASLGIGFVVGQRTSLPHDLDDQLKIVGLTHIVVASGYNLTILVRFARRLLARHSRYLAFVMSILLMLAFVAFSGLSPSMNRAVAVTGLSLLAWFYGRRFHPLLLISYVAAITALWQPVYIWSDLGWYLSFFAFGGVLIIAPLISVTLFRHKDPPAVTQLFIETLAAELMTLPLIALAFGVFPTFGILANILVGPLIPFAMLATTIAGVVGMALPVLAPIAAIPASVLIGYIVMVVEWLSGIEWAQLQAGATLPLVMIWFTVILVMSIVVWRRTKYDFRSSAITD